MKKAFIKSTGCDRRGLDAARLANYLIENGYQLTNEYKKADLIAYFTCSFKQNTQDISFQNILEFEKAPGELMVFGCLPGIDEEKLKANFSGKYLSTKDFGNIDTFFPDFKVKFIDIPDGNRIYNYNNYIKKSILQKIKNKIKKIEPNPNARIRIANGCSWNCSYCVIPKAIGKIRSKSIEECVKEYKKIIKQGYKKIFFSSEDCGTYGLDINTNLVELLTEIDKIENTEDIKWKIGTFNPFATPKLGEGMLKFIKKGRIIFFRTDHQSGSPRILKLMKRGYDLDKNIELLSKINEIDSKIHTHSSFIMGFPSETDEDVQLTIDLMEKLNLTSYHVFSYDDMKGSESSNFKDKIAPEEKISRLKKIQEYFETKGYTCHFTNHKLTMNK